MASENNGAGLPQVVILGGGYAGGMVARHLDAACKAGKIRLVLVDKRDAMHHKIGSIRASVAGDGWAERIRIPMDKIVRYGRIVLGNAVKVDEEKKVIMFADKDTPPLSYDILICATGMLNHSPGDLPVDLRTSQEVQKYFEETSRAFEEAKDVLIVGGGASAVEYAGEIRHRFPEKKITIISSNSHLLSSSVAPLSTKFLKSLYAKLAEMNIEVIREEKVIKPTELDFGMKKFERNATIKTTGKRNLTINTDLLVWAASWTMEDTLYPVSWQNEIGELNIVDTFQILGQDDVFAIGDISSVAETKQAITLPAKMKFIVNNVLTVAEAMRKGSFNTGAKLKLKHYKIADRATMYLPIGPAKGVSQLNGWVYGDAKTSKWKGKDLYCDLFWTELTGTNAPPIPSDAQN